MPIVLSVSPQDEDHVRLRHILGGGAWTVCAAASADAALAVLRVEAVSVIICESDLQVSCWKDLLGRSRKQGVPPMFIVSSRRADGGLWAEALNLGAYDVLAKPFDAREVLHVVEMAWRRWRAQDHLAYQQAV